MKYGKAAVAALSVLWMGALVVGLCLSADAPSGEILKATPDQFDAGTVAEGKTVAVTTSIQNVGTTPVEITNVRTS